MTFVLGVVYHCTVLTVVIRFESPLRLVLLLLLQVEAAYHSSFTAPATSGPSSVIVRPRVGPSPIRPVDSECQQVRLYSFNSDDAALVLTMIVTKNWYC